MSLLKKHRKNLLMFVLCIACIVSCSYFNVDEVNTTVNAEANQTDIPQPTQMPAVQDSTTSIAVITIATPVATKKVIKPKKMPKKKNTPKNAYLNGYVKVRKSASKKSNEKFLLKPGQKVEVLKKSKKWTKVSINKGTGYVQNKTLSKTKSNALKIAKKKAIKYSLTGYCSCYSCSEGWGAKTRSGREAKAHHTIAADLTVLPLYTDVYIEGMGTYTVEDRGGGVKGRHIDVYCSKHSQCYDIKSKAKVFVIE